jgi:hypothetical protein
MDGIDCYLRHHQPTYHDGERGLLLVFTDVWAEEYLPPQSFTEHGALDVVLLDTTTGKTYSTHIFACYEEVDHGTLTLHDFSYGSHYCQCHRGADVGLDIECEGDRLKVVQITCRGMDDLILYSETYSRQWLEGKLEHAEAS